MIFRLELPALPEIVGSLHLARWQVEVGEPLAYGDVVCTLRVTSIVLPERSITGRALLGRRRGRTDAGRRQLPAAFDVRVVASDDGVLRRHDVTEGEAVTEGAVLGLATTEADEPLDSAISTHGFRLLVDMDDEGGDT